MFYTCITRFDGMKNVKILQNIWKVNKAKRSPPDSMLADLKSPIDITDRNFSAVD